MRGKRTSIAKTKINLVLVSARYEPGTQNLIFARGYERRGQVWMDIKLYDRASLVEALKQGQILATGRSSDPVGDFEILFPVYLSPDERLLAGENGMHAGENGMHAGENGMQNGDNLGLPIL